MHTRPSSSWSVPFSWLSRKILISSSSWEHRSFAKARSALTVFSSRKRSLAFAAIALATCNNKQKAISCFSFFFFFWGKGRFSNFLLSNDKTLPKPNLLYIILTLTGNNYQVKTARNRCMTAVCLYHDGLANLEQTCPAKICLTKECKLHSERTT